MKRGVLALVAGAALLVACDDDPTKVVCKCSPPVERYPRPATPDQLVANFEASHAERNFQEYESLLWENFQFWFAPEDLNLPANGLFWDRAADVASTDRMFNGEMGVRPDGAPQPAVRSIQLTLTPADPNWIDAGGETIGSVTSVPDGARKRRYDVAMRVSYTQGDIVSEVSGREFFYVVPEEMVVGGETVTEWRLAIWRDFGDVRKVATESANWGLIKWLY